VAFSAGGDGGRPQPSRLHQTTNIQRRPVHSRAVFIELVAVLFQNYILVCD
jgi:hypothetical protein